MPHVIVKLWPGKTEDQKQRLTKAIAADIGAILGSRDESISVGFEEVAPADWDERVYRPDIAANWDRLHKRPGRTPA